MATNFFSRFAKGFFAANLEYSNLLTKMILVSSLAVFLSAYNSSQSQQEFVGYIPKSLRVLNISALLLLETYAILSGLHNALHGATEESASRPNSPSHQLPSPTHQ